MTGRIHSFESMACADGPGVRFAVFLQGCPLRCSYCHNPDTWDPKGGTPYTPQQVLEQVLPYRPYFGSKGGITLTGGEPLCQGPFVLEFLKQAKAAGLNTALDTAASTGREHWAAILQYTDTALVDLKFCTEADYKAYTGGSLSNVLDFLKLAQQEGVAVWIRHVVVPGLTDQDLEPLLKLVAPFTNIERIELLPFRTLCKGKYQQLGIPFPLDNTPDCDATLLERLQQQLPENYK